MIPDQDPEAKDRPGVSIAITWQSLQYRRMEKDHEGMQRHVTEIMAENLEILVRKNDSLRREEQNSPVVQSAAPDEPSIEDEQSEEEPF